MIHVMNSTNETLKGHGIVAVIRRKDCYLMIRRAEEIRAGGMWCFVGGAIEDGETQEQALVREVREEVGISVRPICKAWECPSIHRDWLLHLWEAEPLSFEITMNPREVADAKWLTPQEILLLPRLIPSVIDFFKAKSLL